MLTVSQPIKKAILGAAACAACVLAAPFGQDDAQALTQYGAKNPSKLGTAVYYKVAGSSNFYASTLTPGPTVRRSRAYGGPMKVVVSRFIYRTNPTNWGSLQHLVLGGLADHLRDHQAGIQVELSSWTSTPTRSPTTASC